MFWAVPDQHPLSACTEGYLISNEMDAQNAFFLIFQEHKNTPPGPKRAISIFDSSIRVWVDALILLVAPSVRLWIEYTERLHETLIIKCLLE